MVRHKHKPVKRSSKRQNNLQVTYNKKSGNVSFILPYKHTKLFFKTFLLILFYLAFNEIV